MKTTTYLVVYKDSANSQELKFGPFASEGIAERFIDQLPSPREHGYKKFTVIQPYMLTDIPIVRRMILATRPQYKAA